MRMFFLDESGDPQPSLPGKFVLGGVVIRPEDWSGLKDALGKIKTSYNVPQNIEVKWRHARHHGGSSSPLQRLTMQDRIRFAQEVLGAIRRCDRARFIGVVIDKVAACQRNPLLNAESLYRQSVLLCMERYQYYLRATRDIGMVVQDQRQNQQDIRLRGFYQSLLSMGTYWTTFPNVIESVFLTPSDHSIGIQFADFAVGALYVAHGTAQPTNIFWDIIQGKVTGSRVTGKRFGLKFWP